VRINDRGPYAGNRILDLSAAAAQAIGMSGVGWVRATIIVKQ
jgi:rare lipoprotein A